MEKQYCDFQIFLKVIFKAQNDHNLVFCYVFFNRISGFHDTWPKLEKWFGDQQNILVKITADVDEETLFKNVENVLMDTMDAVEKGISTCFDCLTL